MSSSANNTTTKWHARIHTNLDWRDPANNNLTHFKLTKEGAKGISVVCILETPSPHPIFVAAYPNHAKVINTRSNMGLEIDTRDKPGLGDWISVDPLTPEGIFPANSDLDRYLACRINEPNQLQRFEAGIERFHPNCGWRSAQNNETKEIWHEFWTLRKIFANEELTVEYGPAFSRNYKTAAMENQGQYDLIYAKRHEVLDKLGVHVVSKQRVPHVKTSTRELMTNLVKKICQNTHLVAAKPHLRLSRIVMKIEKKLKLIRQLTCSIKYNQHELDRCLVYISKSFGQVNENKAFRDLLHAKIKSDCETVKKFKTDYDDLVKLFYLSQISE